VAVSKDFAVTVAADAPSALADAAKRYEAIIRAGSPSSGSITRNAGARADELAGVTVTVAGEDTTLTFETDYSYSLTLPSASPWEAAVHAKSIYGAMYGLETLAQVGDR
jgi:hypothetical protein